VHNEAVVSSLPVVLYNSHPLSQDAQGMHEQGLWHAPALAKCRYTFFHMHCNKAHWEGFGCMLQTLPLEQRAAGISPRCSKWSGEYLYLPCSLQEVCCCCCCKLCSDCRGSIAAESALMDQQHLRSASGLQCTSAQDKSRQLRFSVTLFHKRNVKAVLLETIVPPFFVSFFSLPIPYLRLHER